MHCNPPRSFGVDLQRPTGRGLTIPAHWRPIRHRGVQRRRAALACHSIRVESAATAVSPAAWAHEYHIRDHQGSLRLVLKQEPVLSYRLGLEAANASEEEARFQRVAETRQLDARHARTGIYSARLNAHQADRANGPATVLRVAADDSISLEVFGLYDKAVMGLRLSRAIVPLLAIGGSMGAVPAMGRGLDRPARSYCSAAAHPESLSFPQIEILV